jgi:hypothetical protein
MTARAQPRRWREVKRRPVQGNSPNDRMLRGPDCNRPKRVYADSFPRHSVAAASENPEDSRNAFSKAGGIYLVRCGFKIKTIKTWGTASRWSAPGPSQRTRREELRAPAHRPQMSSDRLFLDRVARQHCPSPLHRHAQTTTHPLPASAKQDISTLQRIGHFYFALTLPLRPCRYGYNKTSIRVARETTRSLYYL